jgi:hypothetical protein
MQPPGSRKQRGRLTPLEQYYNLQGPWRQAWRRQPPQEEASVFKK